MAQLLDRYIDRHADVESGIEEGAGVVTGFPDHPVAQRLHQPRFLGDRDEAGRRNAAELGAVPAQQRFDGADSAADGINLWLEM